MGNGMPLENRNRKFNRAALCAAFGVVLVIAGGTAVFAGDDDDDELPDAKFVRGLLRGLGLRNGQEAGIEYKERPPLVVPPSRNLPPPAAAGSLTANNPAWPADPDEKKRAAERKAKAERKPFDPYKAGDALKPNELAAGKTDKPATKSGEGPDHSPEMTPSQLGYTGGLWSSVLGLGKTFTGEKQVETAKFAREPSRSSLVDPPPGYRTPSPTQPYGINSKAEMPKAGPQDRQTGDFGK
jgi:hypothetical protein